MSAVPVPDPVVEERRERILLAGDLPSPANPPSGCRFHTRCPWRQETRCDTEVPVLRELGPRHLVSCHWAEDIRDGLLRPKSPEEVAATQGVSVRPGGGEVEESDALVQGVDQPIERT
jgi:peptide/nickel transport system ATP-binding protein